MGLIKTKERWYPNTSIEFAENGMWLRVSLNIESSLAKYLSPSNVVIGKNRTVYALRHFVATDLICKTTLEYVHRMLLENCMKNIRNAKAKKEN